MFRLHLDIPLPENEQEALELAAKAIASINFKMMGEAGVKTVQYRLGKDDDRTPRNYLNKDENGHATTKKIRIEL